MRRAAYGMRPAPGAPSASGRPTFGVIAKVEPLTTARSLRGPFDYLLAAPTAASGWAAMLVVPFGAARILGVVVEVAEDSDLPPERLAEPLSALEADVPPELVRLGLWVAEEYVSTPARGLALVLPPGTGTGAGGRTAARRSLVARSPTPGGRRSTGGERLGDGQRAALEALGDGAAAGAALARTRAATTPACAGSRSAAWSRSSTRSSRRGGRRCGAWARAAACESPPPPSRPRSRRRSCGDGRPRRTPIAACCCTA